MENYGKLWKNMERYGNTTQQSGIIWNNMEYIYIYIYIESYGKILKIMERYRTNTR